MNLPMKSKHRAGPPMTLGNVRRICLSIRAIAGLDQDQKTGSAGRDKADRRLALRASLAHPFGRDGCDGVSSSRLWAARRRPLPWAVVLARKEQAMLRADAKRAVIREWLALPADQRKTKEQAVAYAMTAAYRVQISLQG
jgi:hypothetical protein